MRSRWTRSGVVAPQPRPAPRAARRGPRVRSVRATSAFCICGRRGSHASSGRASMIRRTCSASAAAKADTVRTAHRQNGIGCSASVREPSSGSHGVSWRSRKSPWARRIGGLERRSGGRGLLECQVLHELQIGGEVIRRARVFGRSRQPISAVPASPAPPRPAARSIGRRLSPLALSPRGRAAARSAPTCSQGRAAPAPCAAPAPGPAPAPSAAFHSS